MDFLAEQNDIPDTKVQFLSGFARRFQQSPRSKHPFLVAGKVSKKRRCILELGSPRLMELVCGIERGPRLDNLPLLKPRCHYLTELSRRTEQGPRLQNPLLPLAA